MPVVTGYAPGAPCWYELATTDRDAANAFYSDIFGWTVDSVPTGPGQTYTMYKLGGQDVGAACDLQRPDAPPHWLTYFTSPDIDVAVGKAAELGGSVTAGPFDVATHGRMAVVAGIGGRVFRALETRYTHWRNTPRRQQFCVLVGTGDPRQRSGRDILRRIARCIDQEPSGAGGVH
ncbi:MAG: VOC family protein [Bryobacteraceae bacterium]|nr:VOC family protein [Bryobacteraceae bacterium]